MNLIIEPGNIHSGHVNIGRGDFDPNLSRIEKFNSFFKFDRLYINKPQVIEVGPKIYDYVWTDVYLDGLYNFRNFRKDGNSVQGFFIIRKEIVTVVTQAFALQYVIDRELIDRNEN